MAWLYILFADLFENRMALRFEMVGAVIQMGAAVCGNHLCHPRNHPPSRALNESRRLKVPSCLSRSNRIVKMTAVLADSADYDEMNRVWREFFPTDPPARITCALQLSNGNGVEIECIALARESPS